MFTDSFHTAQGVGCLGFEACHFDQGAVVKDDVGRDAQPLRDEAPELAQPLEEFLIKRQVGRGPLR